MSGGVAIEGAVGAADSAAELAAAASAVAATRGQAEVAARRPHTLPRWLLPAGHFFFAHRNWVFPCVFVALVGATQPMAFPGGTRIAGVSADAWVDALGVTMAFAGQLLRAAAIGLDYIRRGGRHKKVHADRLVTQGLFAHSRNPLYLGNFLAMMGLFVVHGSGGALLLGAAFYTIAYLAIVAAEEDYLRQRYGADYEAYLRRVPRFRLRLAGLRGTLCASAFDWRRLVRKEYGSTFAGTSAILGMLLWEAWRRGGSAAIRARAEVLGPVWGGLLVLYLLARTLKKRGALGHG